MLNQSDESRDALMSRWMVVDTPTGDRLFGFADWHPDTGGLSWVLSTPIVNIDRENGRARTASGRHYRLGQPIGAGELDEEGAVALRMRLGFACSRSSFKLVDLLWLSTCKMARHLDLPLPQRGKFADMKVFFDDHYPAYSQLRAFVEPQ